MPPDIILNQFSPPNRHYEAYKLYTSKKDNNGQKRNGDGIQPLVRGIKSVANAYDIQDEVTPRTVVTHKD
jgi:hypothetical protein